MSGTASATGKKNKIVLQARSSRTKVRITVSGKIEKGRYAGDTDTIKGKDVAVSKINTKGELDSFRFSGEITDFDIIKGDVKVTLNGKDVDPDELGEQRRLTLQAQGLIVTYDFTVSGSVEAGSDADIGRGDDIDGRTVSGNVAGAGVDDYLFTGEITEFNTSSDNVTVTLDGEEVDPDEVA